MSNVAYTPLDAPPTRSKPSRVLISKNGECRLRLNFMIFFDGTNNNRYQDMPSFSHSNVTRLYNATYDEPVNGLNAIYVPGVGTPFPEIGEHAPHKDGARSGEMGAERIRYALLEIINRISRLLMKKDLVPKGKIPEAVKSDANYTSWNHRLTALIAQRRSQDLAPHLEEIVIDVFGFSRGAAAARSFVNQLLKHFGQSGKFFCSAPLRIRFMGLFDTVASVGLADSFPLPVEGHQKWGDEDLLVIPPQVEQCVHFVAGHEGRKSFPVDLVLGKDGQYPSNCIEVVYPGVHSDVGGGYGPHDQGKGTGMRGQDEMLSQIPLNHMYQRALAAGVPLRPPEKLAEAPRLEAQFKIGDGVRRYYDAYMEKVAPRCKGLPATGHYLEHFRWYLSWRKAVMHPATFRELACVAPARCGLQDRVNLIEANNELYRYITEIESGEKLKALRRQRAIRDQVIGSRGAAAAKVVDLVDDKLRPSVEYYEEGERYYQRYWSRAPSCSRDVWYFFEYCVHDSRAGFCLTDPISRHDHTVIHERLKQKDRQYQEALSEYERKVADYHVRGEQSGYTATTLPTKPSDPLSRREREYLEIYDRGGEHRPLFDDAHPASDSDGEFGAVDVVRSLGGRREMPWSYLHPRQHFAYSRLTF